VVDASLEMVKLLLRTAFGTFIRAVIKQDSYGNELRQALRYVGVAGTYFRQETSLSQKQEQRAMNEDQTLGTFSYALIHKVADGYRIPGNGRV
jgi:hypothetical protein